jgi:tetratricopeptide (TPR) repeat protein
LTVRAGRYSEPVEERPDSSSVQHASDDLAATRVFYGDDHPDTFEASLRLARAHRHAGDTQAARSLLLEVLAAQRRVLGDDHVDTTRTEFELGLVLSRLGDHFSACEVQERVLASADLQYGPDSEYSTRAAVNLANSLRKLKRYDAELALRERIVTARRQAVGTQDLAFFRSLADLAVVNQHLEHFNLALELSQVVVDGFVEHQVDRRTIIEVQLNIVNTLVRLKRVSEAAELFEVVYTEIVRDFPADDPVRRHVEKQKLLMGLLGKAARRREAQRLRKQGRKESAG